MKEISVAVLKEKHDSKGLCKDASRVEDHFPEWQQDIVKKMTEEAAQGVEEQITLHGKENEAAAKAAAKDAEWSQRCVMADAVEREDGESDSEWERALGRGF